MGDAEATQIFAPFSVNFARASDFRCSGDRVIGSLPLSFDTSPRGAVVRAYQPPVGGNGGCSLFICSSDGNYLAAPIRVKVHPSVNFVKTSFRLVAFTSDDPGALEIRGSSNYVIG
jgi:hypothetical protein